MRSNVIDCTPTLNSIKKKQQPETIKTIREKNKRKTILKKMWKI